MDETVRVLTYNVRRDIAADGEFDWAGRRAAVGGTIRLHRPDVVGLQEPLPEQYADLRDALPGYEWVGQSRDSVAGEGEFCPVGYRADRFDCLETDTFWLSESPDTAGSVGWDGTYPRVATWVHLRERSSDRRWWYLNTHLDHEGERARREGARLVRDRVCALRGSEPAVVAGDFNCTPDGEAYATLVGSADHESPLVDARERSPHPPYGPTTTRTDFESLLPGMRIDHVFVADWAVADYAVAADMGGDGWFPSDHLPVVVDLEP